ncbi:MAG: RagB/SusD family nutrient uptake outer membrane protein [Gemmatimonadetes bacterium]|nr:RagB/SusD family nutrient uptake outer membrane protein [Gemmatimonadota bacterium]
MKTISQFLVAGAALALGACSFDVTNPGPIADEALNDAGAYEAIVRGVRYNLSRAISINTFYSAVAAKEYSTSGRVHGTKLPLVFGQLDVDDVNANTWVWSHAARWSAENGIERLRKALSAGFASNRSAGQLLMYAALINRMLGECMCEAVIDGGAKQAYTVYLTRAETQATEAIAVATAAGDTPTRQAAYAVRAGIRLVLGNFSGAGSDAAPANVPTSFVLTAPFDESTQNLLVATNDFALGGNFRASTVWRTFFESYFRTTGDLRVRWDSSILGGKARDGEFTGIPWLYQRKYIPTGTIADRSSPIRLASGREMRLLEAEVALRSGDITTAMGLVNGIRAGQAVRAGSPALTPWSATTVQEAWDALKKERSIELWLEGRTMADLRRWIADGTYPSMFTIEPDRGTVVRSGFTFGLGSENDVADRVRLCLPISRQERNNNANLSLQPDDPRSPIYTGPGAPW